MSKGFASSARMAFLGGLLLLCYAALGARLVWLHVVDREALLKPLAKVRPMLIPEAARRGDILDARGARLATSRSEILLGVDPHSLLPRDERKWVELAALIELPEAELRDRFQPRFRRAGARGEEGDDAGEAPVPFAVPAARGGEDEQWPITWVKLREDVSESVYERVRRLDIRGVYGIRHYRRVYPSNELAAHVIGYVNREHQAAAGIEAYADFYLRGQQGWRVGERDGRNRELPQFASREVPRRDGYSVVLSIDSTVQDIVEQELVQLAARFEPRKASIVVSDLDGFVLALANYPSFNLNEFNRVPKAEEARMKNAAVADIYDPGSVFKIVPAAGALEERLVTPQTVLDCTVSRLAHRGRMLSLPAEDHKMGNLRIGEILSHSSNRGAAQLGVMLGEERLERYARAFGFGAKLGFPVGGEVAGILHPHQRWYPIDITRIPMGHSVSSTVLQMHQAMAVIAAGGVLLRPQVIREIRDAANETVYRYGRTEIGRAVSPRTAAQIAAMLVGVTRKGGTALEASIEGFDVAGKTGTSQKFVDGQWSKKHHIASFSGFFPAAQPKVVITVIVDDADHKAPGGVAYGRTVAAPSFKRIGERLIPILDIRAGAAAVPALLVARQGGGAR